MNNKKVFNIIVFIAIVLVVSWYVFNQGAQPAAAPSQTQTQTNPNQAKTMLAGTPPLMLVGNVSKIDGQKITMSDGKADRVVVVDSTTKVTKEVKDGQSFKNTPATISDIKVEAQVVVNYKQNSDGTYTAEMIDILNF